MDCNNYALHEKLNNIGFETIILSTGMSNIEEISRAISFYDKNLEVLVMSCKVVIQQIWKMLI